MISYLINVKSSMSFGEELYACAVMWSFMSLFFVLTLYTNVKKKKQKLKVGRVMLFRFFYGLIMFYTIGPAMVFVDFMVIWFTGISTSLTGLWLKLLGNPVYLPEDSTKTLIVFLKCKKCNVNISEFDRVCPKCGEPTDNYDYMGKCKSCMHFFKIGEQVCPNCGHEVVSPSSIILMNKIPELTIKPNNSETANTVAVSNIAASATTPPVVSTVQYASKADYNSDYSTMGEDMLLNSFIQKELTKLNMNDLKKQLPKSVYRKKLILNILFIVLLFFFNVLIFFHFDLYIYIVYAIILIILFILTRKFSITKYYMKEIKSRPSEKISNIILSTKNDYVRDKSKFILLIGLLICILIPGLYFREPRIYYERSENNDGYVVRFYTLGITGNEKAVIPDIYKDEPVVGIRGNVFKNMFFLKEVELPDTVTEIRGSAFKNDINLEKVKLPSNLIRIGGGAFANCIKLKEIEIPESVIEIGGEAFLNDSSLEKINLPSKITEIRGNTFQNCSSLKSIEIPDNVTRIAAHAFHDCTKLSEVIVSEHSKLTNIGSSAFRECYSLREIKIPSSTIVDSRAFKNSGTQVNRFETSGYINANETLENIQTEPIADPKPVIEPEPVADPEPVVKPEPVVEVPTQEPFDDNTKPITYKSTGYITDTLKPRENVTYTKYDLSVEYNSLYDNKATFIVNYNNETRIIEYEIGESHLYYAFDNFVIHISGNKSKNLFVVVNNMSKINNGYKYYINYSFKPNSSIEFKSDNIKREVINIGNLEPPVNDIYSINMQLSGDTTDTITLTNINNKYVTNDFIIEIRNYSEYSNYAVIYLN